jgi:hypothetical protein
MSRLNELLEKWKAQTISAEEFRELRDLVSSPEGRQELHANFQFDCQLLESIQLNKRQWQEEQREPSVSDNFFHGWSMLWRKAWIPGVAVMGGVLLAWALVKPKQEVLAYNVSSFGTVQAENPHSKQKLKAGDPIFSNSKISTCDIGRAALRFASDRHEGTKLLLLEEGEIELVVAAQPEHSKVLIESRFGQVEVVGTKLRVTLNNAHMAVRVEEGSVKVTSIKSEKATVVAGQRVELHKSGKIKKGKCGESCASVESQWEWVEDQDARIDYQGGWVRDLLKSKSVHKSAEGTSRLQIKFRGEAIRLIGDKNFCGGTASVFLDGVSHGTINFNAAAPGFRSLPIFATNALSNDEHTLTVVCNGDGWVYLDAISVRTHCGEDK